MQAVLFCSLCSDFTAGAGREDDGANRLDGFTIGSFYEASGHKLEGEALLTINRRAVEKMISVCEENNSFVGKTT